MANGPAAIRMTLTPESRQAIRAFADKPAHVTRALQSGLSQGLAEAETHLKVEYLSGQFQKGATRGGRPPVAVRSGNLRRSVISRRDEPLSGFVGVVRGPATRYAATILGDERTTIRPTRAKQLWIPVGDNLNASGQTRLTPREAIEGGAFVVVSKQGNAVALTRGRVPGTAQRKKPRLIFVLKREVVIQGTGAMTQAAEDMGPRVRDLLNRAVRSTLDEARGGGG